MTTYILFPLLVVLALFINEIGFPQNSGKLIRSIALVFSCLILVACMCKWGPMKPGHLILSFLGLFIPICVVLFAIRKKLC
ncbi:MAG: hypothetical protein Q4D38_09830 [Planctomycetia bacterium]|nr:hypothetical protein [Planctomycetia bacterium]